ncbi:MAG: hypothetical protein MJA29_14365 [Candidatus Omnitrophica bacterium]|nr:hypothetical protein [Candidatus Omnitrophota bacterium]
MERARGAPIKMFMGIPTCPGLLAEPARVSVSSCFGERWEESRKDPQKETGPNNACYKDRPVHKYMYQIKSSLFEIYQELKLATGSQYLDYAVGNNQTGPPWEKGERRVSPPPFSFNIQSESVLYD